jgi:hypothetical protein
MSRKVKEFIDIRDYTGLEFLIEQLIKIRDNLPPHAQPELKMKGDDIFGRILSVSYFRPQTPDEAACDARYAEAYRNSRAPQSRDFDTGSCRLPLVP